MGDTLTNPPALELPADHPGVQRPRLPGPARPRSPRSARRHRPGEPDPRGALHARGGRASGDVVSVRARPKHRRLRLPGVPRRRPSAWPCPTDRVPQLHEVDARVRELTGFRIRAGARPGADRQFYGALAERRVPVDAVHPPPLGALLHTRARHRPRDHRPRQHARLPGVRRPLRGRRAARRCGPRTGRGARVLQPGVLVHARVRRRLGGRRAAGLRRRAAVVLRRDRGVPRRRDPPVGPRRRWARSTTTSRSTNRCCSRRRSLRGDGPASSTTFFDSYDDDTRRTTHAWPTVERTARPGGRRPPTCSAGTASSSGSATPAPPPGSSCRAFGFRCTGYAGPETGRARPRPATCSSRATSASSSPACARPRLADRRPRPHARRRRARPRLARRRRRRRLRRRRSTAGARPVRDAVGRDATTHGDPAPRPVATYGETRAHVRRPQPLPRRRSLEPGYTTERLPPTPVGPPVGLPGIDHVVGNVEQGALERLGRLLRRRPGLRPSCVHFDDDQISHRVLGADVDGGVGRPKIVMPINEPADGLRKSQIQEYLETYDGPGVQHIALRTDDIVATVERAARAGRAVHGACPTTYYDEARERLAGVDLPWDELQRLNILVDRDHDGLPAADLHRDDHRPAHGVLRDHRAPRRQGLRRGQLQGAVRGHRARPGPPRQPLTAPARRATPPTASTPASGSTTCRFGVGGPRRRRRAGRAPIGDRVVARRRRRRRRLPSAARPSNALTGRRGPTTWAAVATGGR